MCESPTDLIEKFGKHISKLLKDANILSKTVVKDKWTLGVAQGKNTYVFEDRDPVDKYCGFFFKTLDESGADKFYFYPPEEIKNKLEQSSEHPADMGIWVAKRTSPKKKSAKKTSPSKIVAKKTSPKKSLITSPSKIVVKKTSPSKIVVKKTSPKKLITSPKKLITSPKKKKVDLIEKITDEGARDYDFTSVTSTSELRDWDPRKISKYLLNESPSYEALLACIITQLDRVGGEEAKTASQQLYTLMKTTTDEAPKSPRISPRKNKTTPIKTKSPSPKLISRSKSKSPSPKLKSPGLSKTTTMSPSSMEKELERIAETISSNEEKLKTTTNNVARNIILKRIKELEEKQNELFNKLGFGRTRLQSNRRHNRVRKISKRVSLKKISRRRTPRKRTSRKRAFKRRTSKVSKLQRKKKTSRARAKLLRRKSKKSKKFGSVIYGLQDGPAYTGVYPMTLDVIGTPPNLFNVKRTFSLGE